MIFIIPTKHFGVFLCFALNLFATRQINHSDRFYDSLQRFKVPIPDILAPSTAFPNINGLSITYAI